MQFSDNCREIRFTGNVRERLLSLVIVELVSDSA